jgi:PKHD-type hydroxylase
MNFLHREDRARADVDLGTHSTFGGVFTAEECDRVSALLREHKQVAGENFTDVRRSEVRWLRLEDAPWAFERIRGIVLAANAAFGFDVVGLESLQLTEYDAAYRGHYDWHMDFGAGPVMRFRKLSVVVQLSDPADYDGGELFVCTASRTRHSMATPVCAQQGCAVVFPAYMLHRVSEVTRGTRRSLVGWVEGPPFR